VFRRIIEPFEGGEEFGRAGWLSGYNNWSPWCASNVLGAAFCLLDDREWLASLTVRLMAVVDRFIDRYGADGGCDEGPGYWNEAAGAMLVFLELLGSRTGGAVDVYGEPKIAAMAHYIASAHLDGPWFANFADASPRANPHPGKIYRFGERVGSEVLKDLALQSMRNWQPGGAVAPPLRIAGVSRPLLGPLMELFWIPPETEPTWLPREAAVWLRDVQALFARETAEPSQGLVLAAKGGHNAESHNHNDLGSFIILLDGQPAIVDVGAPTYTRKTFSADRYDIWCIRASGHGVPLVNGVEQAAGGERRATHVALHSEAGTLQLGMNLEAAYPPEAALRSLRREISFQTDPPASIRVADAFECSAGPATVRVPLFAARQPEVAEPGRMAIPCGARRLVLTFDPAVLTATVERVPLHDDRLRTAWGRDALHRIDLACTSEEPAGSYELAFGAEEGSAG
jgi:hypothetical protein